MSPRWIFVGGKPEPGPGLEDWQQARPRSIQRALERALERPSGGWFVLDASRRIGARPRKFQVDGRLLVAWRDGEGLLVADESCPHMGASLEGARVCRGRAVCPWHGLELGREGHGSWRPHRSFDDGVLSWVCLAEEGEATDAPILPPRPEVYMDGVIRVEAVCDPQDVIKNRLDPWHGRHFHPYSFAALEVLDDTGDVLTVRVQKRIAGPMRVEVDATFHCPDPRTIVMTVIAGEGEGSVVETHATPIAPGRSAVIEATLASSTRPGFRFAQKVSRFVRPFIERSARRLWVDDVAYAERLYELRMRKGGVGVTLEV